MADYTKTKRWGESILADGTIDGNAANIYPVNAKETTSLFGRVEPIITPSKMVSRYLKGLDLSDYNDNELKDYIEQAMNEVELLTDLKLTPVQFIERYPFDIKEYRAFVYIKTRNKPILSLESLRIESSNREFIFQLPPEWIDAGRFHAGQVNIVPLVQMMGSYGFRESQPSNAGLIFLKAIDNYSWLPGFFTITYTVGVCRKEGHLPNVLNQIVGMTAAIEILGNKLAQHKYTSTSISQDGISQSASGLLFENRIAQLKEKRERLLQKIKGKLGNKYYFTNI